MSNKKVISICPTGHESWYKELTGKNKEPEMDDFFAALTVKKKYIVNEPKPTKLAGIVSVALNTGLPPLLLDLIQKRISKEVDKEIKKETSPFNKPNVNRGIYLNSPGNIGHGICNTTSLGGVPVQFKHPKTETDIFGILKDAYASEFGLSLTKRREQICKVHHVCPACHAVQVQLVSWINPIIIRKCRICKHIHCQYIPV